MIRDAETQTLLEDTIRRFVRERLVPREAEVDETDAIPEDIVEAMREIGLFGLTIPEAHGGLGLTMEEEVRIAFELGQTSPAERFTANAPEAGIYTVIARKSGVIFQDWWVSAGQLIGGKIMQGVVA